MLFDFTLTELIFRFPAILISLSVHEFSHGFAAYLLGDKTAKYDGRLSLNPLRHIDPMGAIFMLLFRFGWAKPVMINTRNFKSPKLDMALSAFAGPLSNFILAFISLLVYYPLVYFFYDNTAIEYVAMFLWEFFAINISLGIFNMLPIPPLDGSKTLSFILPDDLYFRFISAGRYGMLILIILIYTGASTHILTPILTEVYNFYFPLVQKIYFFLS